MQTNEPKRINCYVSVRPHFFYLLNYATHLSKKPGIPKTKKHRVTIPCKWVFRFHMKSAGFQVKSTQNLIKSDVSTKTIQFDECRRGAMTLDFLKSGVIAPSMHPPKLKRFNKVLGGFHEIRRISWMWAFGWWSSIGLSFERPKRTKKKDFAIQW